MVRAGLMSGMNLFQLSLFIAEPPVSGLLIVGRMSGGGRIVPPVVSPMVQMLVSMYPPLVFRLSLFSSRRGLPSFAPQMVQIVLPLLIVPPGFIKCSDGFLWFPALFLYEISGYQIPRPVEAVGAVDPYQPPLSLRLQDLSVEFLHTGLTRDRAATSHADLDVAPAQLLAVIRLVVAVCVGQVHDMFQ